MSYTTPKYGLVVPSPATRLNQLGTQLQQMGISVEEVLDTFDYNGADPNLVLSRVAALEATTTWLEHQSFYTGTPAERAALSPAPTGAMWQDNTASGRLWSSAPNGSWRLHEGHSSTPAAAWTSTVAPWYARQVTVTIPTALSTDETIMIAPSELNEPGYVAISLETITRNTTTTDLSVRLMKFNHNGTIPCAFAWRIIKKG